MSNEAREVSAHTPGPWHLHDLEENTVCGPDHLAIGITEARARKPEVNSANARLIAAAPDLFASLKEMLDLYIWDSDASDRAKAAIAKAECQPGSEGAQ